MPRVHEMIESKFLKKEDAERPVLATISTVDQQNVAAPGAGNEMKWCMHFKELDKPLVLNSTNIQLCKSIFGSDDTDDWLGKQIVLYNDPNVSYAGKLTGGIRVRAPKKQAQAPQAEQAPRKRTFEEEMESNDIDF
jgi:hypothetical protein